VVALALDASLGASKASFAEGQGADSGMAQAEAVVAPPVGVERGHMKSTDKEDCLS